MGKKYNGHRSWNAWNVSLWINNDYDLYCWSRDMVSIYGTKKAARIMAEELAGKTTPDGAKYNVTCIYEAIKGGR